jgi:sugar lactone lactonase YvrE
MAQFKSPSQIAVDAEGNVYVADQVNERIRRIAPDGTTSTVAGNGTPGFADGSGDTAEFRRPCGMGVDPQGNLYVADFLNNRIRKVTITGGH